MTDPLLSFKRWEGEPPDGGQVSPETDNLLHIAGGGAGPGDGFVSLRLVAGALSTRTNAGEIRLHVVDCVLPAPTAAQLGLILFEAAKQSGFDPTPELVEAEVVE